MCRLLCDQLFLFPLRSLSLSSLYISFLLELIIKTFTGPQNMAAGKMNNAANTQRNNLWIFMSKLGTNGRVGLFTRQTGRQSVSWACWHLNYDF